MRFPMVAATAFMLLAPALTAMASGVTPTPPPRPTEFGLPPPAETNPPAAAPPDAICAHAMASGRMVAELVAPVVGTLVGPDQCGVAAPLKLRAIILANGAHIPLEPESLLRCDFAETLADWVREDVAPLARTAGGGLDKILGSDGYECRGRNRVAGAVISEHAFGNALDLRGFKFHDGRTLWIGDANQDLDLMTQLRAASCARFTTVLGPGSDGAHQVHIHLDLKQRRNAYRICQWDLE